MLNYNNEITLKNAKTNIDILNVLSEEADAIKNLNVKIEEINIHNSKALCKLKNPDYLQALKSTIEQFIKSDNINEARNLLKDVLISKDGNQGKFFEMMTYYSLFKLNLNFNPQPHIKSEDCYRQK